MHFTDYQQKAKQTAKYPVIGHGVIYPTLGLTNEAGEVSGKIKKIFRDKGGVISMEDRQALKAELGDVLWYLTQVASELDLSLEEIAEHNIAKLLDRQRRGKISRRRGQSIRSFKNQKNRIQMESRKKRVIGESRKSVRAWIESHKRKEILIFFLHRLPLLFGTIFTDPIRLFWVEE